MKNYRVRGCASAVLCLCAMAGAISREAAAGVPFATVINVPTDPAPAFIGSDTQLNLFDGGQLQDGFNLAGTLYGLNSNIEVNIEGGVAGNNLLVGVPDGFGTNSDVRLNINGGIVGSGLSVNAGGIVSINGGVVGDRLEVNAGGIVNLNGGTLGDFVTPYNGSTFNINGGSIGAFFEPRNNTTVNIAGGTVGEHFSLGFDTTLSISGGVLEGPGIQRGGTLNLSGGNFDNFIWDNNEVNITGSEFRFNGLPIPGLGSAGDSIVFDPPETGFLTTTFADGAVLARSVSGPLNLYVVAAPVKPAVINSPGDTEPLGLRDGQTLNLSAGAELVSYFTAVDSTLNVHGGNVGRGLRVYGTDVGITGGAVGEYFRAYAGSTVHISGGEVSHGMTLHESNARITGGHVASLDVTSNSVVDIFGGVIDDIDALSGSVVNLTGVSFTLDGVDLTPGLVPGEKLVITDRGVILEGILSDGSAFSFDLTPSSADISSNFDSTSTLAIILVPEPGTAALLGAGALGVLKRRGRG